MCSCNSPHRKRVSGSPSVPSCRLVKPQCQTALFSTSPSQPAPSDTTTACLRCLPLLFSICLLGKSTKSIVICCDRQGYAEESSSWKADGTKREWTGRYVKQIWTSQCLRQVVGRTRVGRMEGSPPPTGLIFGC